MKKTLWAVVMLLASTAASAAIEYDFQQSIRSDIAENPSSDLTGRAIIDGERSRVDFVGGTTYPPGTFVISTDGSRTLRFVDPLSKSFTEINAAGVAVALGSGRIKVENLKSSVQKMPEMERIAGIATDHYRLTITYDMTVTFRTVPLKQTVRTEIDKWTTVEFGDIAETFLAGGGVRTGSPDLDQLIELETTKIKGFPMRQRVRITTSTATAPRGELAKVFSPTRTQTRDFIITGIRRIEPRAELFAIPNGYGKARQGDLKETKVQILSLEPPTK